MKLCPGPSVGAIIKNTVGEYLVLYRKSFPPGLAFVAGHIHEGETPEQALKREVYEECGLTVLEFRLTVHRIFENPCKRGFTAHDWFVYEIFHYQGEPILKEPDKHEFVKFMNLFDIKTYFLNNDIDPAWKKILLNL